MGVFCYVFYEGVYFILNLIPGAILPIRLFILIAIFITVMFSAGVYFVMELKLKAVNEEELKGFPKGTALVKLAKKLNLL